MTFNFLGPGLTVNVEAKVKEQIILDSSEAKAHFFTTTVFFRYALFESTNIPQKNIRGKYYG